MLQCVYMHKQRMEQLADGIFAIVMTLLVFEFQVPAFSISVDNLTLWQALRETLVPSLGSYILSFTMLATYWTGHHYTVSLIAQNLNRRLAYLNIPFLMTVALIPFSTRLLSSYYYTQTAIGIYGVNVIVIGLFLFILAYYIIHSPEIKNSPAFTLADIRRAYVRILMPPAIAAIAILVSLVNPVVSIYFFILAVIVNLLPGVTHFLDKSLS